MVFCQLQGGFRLADAPLCPGLGSVGAPVPGKVQLSPVDVLHPLRQGPVEKFGGVLGMAPGRALQIGAAAEGFHHFPGGAAASVPVAEGEHEAGNALLLRPVLLPAGDQVLRAEHGVVFLKQVGQYPAAVQALPPEYIVGKGLRLRVLADQLLGGEVGNPAFFHNLGQGGGKAEGIRHPGKYALHPQLPAEPTLPPDELPDQAFPGGNVGVGFHPQRSLGVKRAGLGLFLNPFP